MVLPEAFNVAEYLVDRNVAEGRGDKPAIYYQEQVLTYRDVQQGVNRCGNLLKGLGLQRENRVLLLLLDSPEFVYGFFGAIKIGAVPIPTNTLLRPKDYAYMLNDSRARICMVNDVLLPQVLAVKDELHYLEHIVVVGEAPEGTLSYAVLAAQASPELQPADTHRDEPAYWQYSSGTTGFPKGAVHLHHDMVFSLEAYAEPVLKMSQEDLCFSVAKLFFAYGLGNGLFFPFGIGAASVLFPGRPDPDKVMEAVQRYRPTIFFSVPTSFNAILNLPGVKDYDTSSVRVAVSAGEALPPEVYRKWLATFGHEILDGIGSTECAHIFISNRAGKVKPGSSGTLVPGYEAKILDDDGLPVPQGETGNLLIKGDSIAAYYWNKHEKSKETFLGAWIFGGDKYYQDEEGYFYYAGRSDDMIKAGGIWVSPVEVENALIEHQAVLECGVIGQEDSDALVKPKAYVVLKSGYQPSADTEKDLKEFVKTKIAHYKYPRWIEFVEALPKTATGKIQRYKLRQLSRGEAVES